ncbi:MAG TPA: lytic transglycosylase domain-containing protein [Polyangiaceae bacterium]|jgi:soluble lytic murein transglycosylase
MKVRVSVAAALALATCALGVRCHGAGGREAPADSNKPEVDAADASAKAEMGPPLWVVMDDARFKDARALEDDAHHAEAAAALEADLPKTTSAKERCEGEYVVARLRALAGDDAGAAAAFDLASAGEGCALLADYARARAAASYERLGKTDEAIARAAGVDASLPIGDETALVRAEALGARGDFAQAIPIWRAQIAKHPHGPRWVDTATRLAGALLDGKDGDAASHAREAFDLATRVVVEAPTFEDATNAPALRKRAEALDASLPRELTLDERLRRARALLDGKQAEKARNELEAAIAAIPPKERAASDVACRASSLRAQIAARTKHGAAADAWGDAIRACAKETDALAAALFSGAKASTGQRPDEALERYGRIEKEFPKHRLADDARLASAMIVRDRDAARAETMLLTLPDAYPEGDMRSEALFRAALDHIARGDWTGAEAPLDRAAEIDAPSFHWAVAGRAEYFRARCAAKTGDLEGAKRRWVEIIRAHPLAYYMAESYDRLAEVDGALARSTLAAAVAAEPAGPFVTREHPELATPAFARAVALLDVGEIDSARKELLASGATVDRADPELVWIAASLLDRAGAWDVGHSFARGRLTDFLAHYPSGRWRLPWEAAYPRAFAPIVTSVAESEHVPAPVLWGVMREESAFIADVKSPANAHGLMQLLPSTAKLVARGTGLSSDETALHTPRVSVALGAKLLAQLRASFPDDPALAIPAYNAGAGAVHAWLKARPAMDFDVWVEQIPFEETRNYVKRVLASELAYATLYAPDDAKEVLALPARASAE